MERTDSFSHAGNNLRTFEFSLGGSIGRRGADRLLWGRTHAYPGSGVGHYAGATDHDQWDWIAR